MKREFNRICYMQLKLLFAVKYNVRSRIRKKLVYLSITTQIKNYLSHLNEFLFFRGHQSSMHHLNKFFVLMLICPL